MKGEINQRALDTQVPGYNKQNLAAVIERMFRSRPREFLIKEEQQGHVKNWDCLVADERSGGWNRDEGVFLHLLLETVFEWQEEVFFEFPPAERSKIADNSLFKYLADLSKRIESKSTRALRNGVSAAWKNIRKSENIPEGLLQVKGQDLNPSGYLLTPEGAVSLLTDPPKKLSPEDTRKLFLTIDRMLRDPYDPKARNQDVDKLFGSFRNQSPEEFEFFMDSFGFALRAKPSRRIVAIQGETGAGKSTLLRAIQAALGAVCKSFKGDSLIVSRFKGNNDHRDDLAVFTGLIAFTTDTLKQGATLDRELIKSLSGGDELTYRPIREAPITREATATIFLAGNYPPKFGLDDRAIAARVVSVEFPPLEGSPDYGLLDRIKESQEARQALAAEFILRAAKFKNGKPPEPPETSKTRVKEWREAELTRLQSWLEERLVADPRGVIVLGGKAGGENVLKVIRDELGEKRKGVEYRTEDVTRDIEKLFPRTKKKSGRMSGGGKRYTEVHGVRLR